MKNQSASWKSQVVLAVAAGGLAAAVACSSSSTSTGGGGGGGGSGGSTCADVCTNLQAVCPAAYTSSCVTDCEAEHETSAGLDCGATATSCTAVAACQTGSGSGTGGDASTGNDGGGGGGTAECHSVDGPGYTSYTCTCGGSIITGCSNGQACDVCNGLGSCSDCKTNP